MTTTQRSEVNRAAAPRPSIPRTPRTMSEPELEPVEPIRPGQTVAVDGLGSLTVRSVTQRNWSRVARAEAGSTQYFVKQFVDRVGAPHRRGHLGDHATSEALGSEVLPGLHVVPALARDDELLLTVFPFIDMTTIDSIAHGRAHHRGPASRVGAALAGILETRTVPHNPDDVAVWKGLDPKNIGWGTDGRLWVFDFGPPSVISRNDAAARVMAAGLLSRWVARPGRHVVSPERPILRGVCEPIAGYTTLEAVEAELRHHKQLRMREPQRRGVAATATRLGLRTLGRIHWAAVQREARRLYAE